MSRCFPYPPPGYTLSKASNDALIESIKLQKEKEREKAKAEKKKERKREKKEKKENKEKNKVKDEKPKKKDGKISHEAYGIFQKVGKEETGLFERSGITEELGQPGNSQDPSNSSDSTQNSNKRKRHDSPVNGAHTGGNILRIRLPSQKQVECKTSSEVDELQRTSGRIDSCKIIDNAGTSRAHLNKQTNTTMVQLVPVEPNKETSRSACKINILPNVAMATKSTTVQLLPVETNKEPIRSASQRSGGSNPKEKHEKHVSKKSKKQHKAAKKYDKLMDRIPLKEANEIMDYDEDWLCPPEPTDMEVQTHNNQISCASSWLSWPRAQYLHEADLYALPYSIPF